MSEHAHRLVERHCDVAVVGGSAAGLAAALQLGRQRRSVIVVDAGAPRNAPATHMHSYLGHDGLPPATLLRVAREEVRRYGGEVLDGRAVDVVRTDDGRFRVELAGGHALVARRVLAATGLVDVLPPVDGLAQRWGRDLVHCPFCHGFELRDRRIVQVVSHPAGHHQTPLWRQLTARLTVVEQPLRRVVVEDDRITGVELAAGTFLDADAVVITPAFRPRTEAFASLGLATAPHPSGLGDVVETDAAGQTAVPGLYAAGNLTDPSQQVLQAAANGSRVGATISLSLAEEDAHAGARRSAVAADWDHRYGGPPLWSGNPNGALVDEVAGLPPGRALDVGAGEGGDAIWLAARGWQVTAVDVAPRALDRVAAEAGRRGLVVACLRADANDLDPFPSGAYDLVTAMYASIPRTPDDRAVHNLLAAVAPGGTLLVVSHDLEPMRAPVDPNRDSRAYDPDAYVRADDVARVLADEHGWQVEVHERRPRPAGAASAHHVHDIVLRACRTGSPSRPSGAAGPRR